jgi:quinoprotein glucose dehydrogenase
VLHDLWEYDVVARPSLIDFHKRPVVALTTKMGFVFILDRTTGRPLHPVEERFVPQRRAAC